jgi:endonuclease/exonuclease/phosphatase family metal-dependent hydrolase
MHAEPERTTIRVGTLNLRNTSDRWRERAGLLVEQLSDLRPDVIGLQEVRRPSLQARRIVSGINHAIPDNRRPFRIYPVWKTGLLRLWEGVAVLTDLPVVEADWLDLRGGNRVAQRARVRVGGTLLDFYNTHLDHSRLAHERRADQAGRILDWMAQRPDVPQVLVGDFNAQPTDPAIQLIGGRMRSAYFAFHNREPERTAPAPLSRHWGSPGIVIDFIFVNERVEVHEASITFDQPHPDDDRLSASDHFGLAATISIRQHPQ